MNPNCLSVEEKCAKKTDDTDPSFTVLTSWYKFTFCTGRAFELQIYTLVKAQGYKKTNLSIENTIERLVRRKASRSWVQTQQVKDVFWINYITEFLCTEGGQMERIIRLGVNGQKNSETSDKDLIDLVLEYTDKYRYCVKSKPNTKSNSDSILSDGFTDSTVSSISDLDMDEDLDYPFHEVLNEIF